MKLETILPEEQRYHMASYPETHLKDGLVYARIGLVLMVWWDAAYQATKIILRKTVEER